MRAVLAAVLITSIAVAAGCGAPAVRNEDDLSDTIRAFNDGVRWERFAVAAVAIPPAQRPQFVDDMDQRSTDVKITDYEIVKVDPHGQREARVQIKLTWYKVSEGTVRETQTLQTWERHGKQWLMVDEARLRGPEMPGLAEPVRDPVHAAAEKPDAACGDASPCGRSVMKD